jgi:hypothetical protein
MNKTYFVPYISAIIWYLVLLSFYICIKIVYARIRVDTMTQLIQLP